MEMAALRQALTQTPQATQIFLSGTAVFFIVSSFLAYTIVWDIFREQQTLHQRSEPIHTVKMDAVIHPFAFFPIIITLHR
jgi:hypothetical protein